MRAYILTDKDFQVLLDNLCRDPQWGTQGGSSQASANDPPEKRAHQEAHRFFWFQIHRWMEQVKA